MLGLAVVTAVNSFAIGVSHGTETNPGLSSESTHSFLNTESFADAPINPFNVTFRVNMNEVASPFTTPEVNGSFNGWCGGCAPMADPDLDGIWEITIALAPGTYEFKYAYDAWTGEEALTPGSPCTVTNFGFTNRLLTVVDADIDLGTVCWNECQDCNVAPSLYDVTFRVNMNNVVDPFTTPEVNGSFNGWCGGCAPMADPDLDGIWEITIPLAPGTYEFKYAYDAWTGQEALTAGTPCTVTNFGFTNRALTVVDQNIDLGTVCWNECQDCNVAPVFYDVTFRLNMNDVTDPFTTPEVNGTFNGWCGGCNPMADPDLDGIWEVTIPLQAGNYEFKYAYDSWTGQETLIEGLPCTVTNAGFTNRSLSVVDQNVDLGTVCWASCENCPPPATTYNVTFRVDMNNVADPFTTPEVNGTFNGWCGGCAPMSDPDLDGVWELVIALEPGIYEFKYAYDSWTGQEALTPGTPCTVTNFGFTNRSLTVVDQDLDLGNVCWASCSSCEAAPVFYDVTFHVNMNEVTEPFGTPEVNGIFNGWCGGCAPMSDPDLDGIWDITIALQPGSYEFKYAYDSWTGQENLTPGSPCTVTNFGFTNRILNVVDQDIDLGVVCWASCADCNVAPVLHNVTFRVDMANEVVSPSGVHIAGSFQGWNPASTPMTQVAFGVWETTLALEEGYYYEWKFVNGNAWGQDESVPGECAQNNNRYVTVGNSDMEIPVVCYANCSLCSGCTNPLSAEFNPFAGTDDGSCLTPSLAGCTYEDATNYNAAATYDDGSCAFDLGSSCPQDINDDGIVNSGDLLALLAAFGSVCP